MSKKTLIDHRVVTDAVAAKLGFKNVHMVHDLPITKKMMTNCRAARMRYSQYLEDQVKGQNKSGELRQELNQAESSAKKHKMENSAEQLFAEADALLKRAEQESDISQLATANSLQIKAKKLMVDAKEENENTYVFQDRLKKNANVVCGVSEEAVGKQCSLI